MDFSSRAEHVLESVLSLVLPAELASTGAQYLFDFRIKSPLILSVYLFLTMPKPSMAAYQGRGFRFCGGSADSSSSFARRAARSD